LRGAGPARRCTLAAGLVTALLATAGGSAQAALPPGHAAFAGSGSIYYNNSPHWVRAQGAAISFGISPDRRRIIDFYGTYTYYCGGGSSYVKARYITISRQGTFRYDFNVPDRAANGHVYGRVYVSIYGHFLHGGKRAEVDYLVDVVQPDRESIGGHHSRVKHPYSPRQPLALGCASWVRGSAHAR